MIQTSMSYSTTNLYYFLLENLSHQLNKHDFIHPFLYKLKEPQDKKGYLIRIIHFNFLIYLECVLFNYEQFKI